MGRTCFSELANFYFEMFSFQQKNYKVYKERGKYSPFRAKRQAGKLIVCRTKPVALFGQGTWGIGWLELRPQKSFTSFRAAFLLLMAREISLYPCSLQNVTFSLLHQGS